MKHGCIPTRTSSIVVGYDLRCEANSRLLHQPDYVAQHLFRYDVARLYSVDNAIWPTQLKRTPAAAANFPEFAGSIQDLWNNLDDLVRVGKLTKGEALKQCRIVAIELICENANQALEWSARTASVTPQTLDNNWQHLGFDVADAFLTSSLCNCGLGAKANAIKIQSKRVSSLLNEYHLFVNALCASEFARISSHYIPEHSPFFVFSIWWYKRSAFDISQ